MLQSSGTLHSLVMNSKSGGTDIFAAATLKWPQVSFAKFLIGSSGPTRNTTKNTICTYLYTLLTMFLRLGLPELPTAESFTAHHKE